MGNGAAISDSSDVIGLTMTDTAIRSVMDGRQESPLKKMPHVALRLLPPKGGVLVRPGEKTATRGGGLVIKVQWGRNSVPRDRPNWATAHEPGLLRSEPDLQSQA